MAWNDAQVLYIFAPPGEPFGNNWVEQILGSVVRPIYDEFGADIDWMWITRYINEYDAENPPGHQAVPQEFLSNNRYRHVLFRLSVAEPVREDLQIKTIDLAHSTGCYTHGVWVDFDVEKDLGSNRFIRSDATEEMRANRARLIAKYIDATVMLMLDSVVQVEGGKWVIEDNSDQLQNPHGSFLESVHHLFSNATMIPTTILLSGKAENLIVGTRHKPFGTLGAPVSFETEAGEFVEIPVRY